EDAMHPAGTAVQMPELRNELMIEGDRSNWVRLRTLVLLRWTAIAGQCVALVVAEAALGLDLPLGLCFVVVGLSAMANLAATLVLPENARLMIRQVTRMLMFDTVQLMLLIGLTGGIANTFALLVLAPVTISATALPLRQTMAIGALAIALASVLAVWNLPMRMHDGSPLILPPLFVAGFWAAIVIG